MEQVSEHAFITENECFEELMWAVDEEELLCDVKKLLSEYYVATFNARGNALNISFNNGQKFSVTVKEIKPIKKTN